MLDIINRYAHGFIATPVILACRDKGMFDLLETKGTLTLTQLVEQLNGNSGHLQVALRLLHSLNLVSCDETGAYTFNDHKQLISTIPKDVLELYHFPFESYLQGEFGAGILQKWIERSYQRWGVNVPLFSAFLDGPLVIPILLGLRKHNISKASTNLFSEFSPSVQEELSTLFVNLKWATQEQRGGLSLTDLGKFMLERSLNLGVSLSYTPMLSKITELLFGDPQIVFQRDAAGHESHVNRALNVIASGFQHQKFFADIDEIILSIFNRLPLKDQPSYVVDMGCGDGTLLKRVYDVISQQSLRGKELAQYPITMVGADYNRQSLDITDENLNLAGIPHQVLRGDIGDPKQLVLDLEAQGINPKDVLHIRSFLDHDRPFIPPTNLERTQARARLNYEVIDVNDEGELIPSHIAVQGLVEHLSRWSSIMTHHGLLILEVHSLAPAVLHRFLDESESLHFDACQSFSMQHLVEADIFLTAAAEANLFPKSDYFKKYPRIFPFTRISLNYFERRLYSIRHPYPDDLHTLIHLESLCWPESLRTSASELQQRIKEFPREQWVVELDGQVVGVAYTQRIESIESLTSSTIESVSTLQSKQGPFLQLLGLNVHPDMQAQGLGDQLRIFLLQWAKLKGGIDCVVGVSRCKSYVDHSHISIEDYIKKQTEQGKVFDPILRFHVEGGASIVGIIPRFRPEDVENQGCGILIRYELHDTFNTEKLKHYNIESPTKKIDSCNLKTITSQVEKSIKTVLGKRRIKAFSPTCTLQEMGLDSLDLLELRVILEKQMRMKLDSTFLFQYSTLEALSNYFSKQPSTLVQPLESRPASQSAPKIQPPAKASPTRSRFSSKSAQVKISRVKNQTVPQEDDIAVIGMACRFPGGVNNPEEFWYVMKNGIDAISEIPANRWDLDRYFDPDHKKPRRISSKYGGFLDQVDGFDADFFHMSSQEAVYTDPQHRILLEESWHALEHAGIDPDSLAGTQTGVFVGLISHDYELLQMKRQQPADSEQYFNIGNSGSAAAGRLAYFLGLKGPAISLDTACSSSLVAVHLASQSLLKGECDVALAAGINLILTPELSIAYSRAGMLSADGRCRAFDIDANGYARSEGCGVVVLKPLSQAKADEDNILAVIKGTAVNQQGFRNKLTAPNVSAQEALFEQAVANSGISARDVFYVETHGSGTFLGDSVEAKALDTVYGKDRDPNNPLVISTVTTNIGYTEAASGIAGMLKVILSLQHQYIPPHLHFNQLNPEIEQNNPSILIPINGYEWKRSDQNCRLAGVSAFGFSGTNAHIILQEAPTLELTNNEEFERPTHVLTLSAKKASSLEKLVNHYIRYLKTSPAEKLPAICFTANAGRAHFEHRVAVVGDSTAEMIEELQSLVTEDGISKDPISQQRKTVGFLFTGQGAQYTGMGKELYHTQPTFRKALDECAQILDPLLDIPLLELLYPLKDDSSNSLLNETVYTQPGLFAVEYALAQVWLSWGIQPDILMGHSFGEYVAACLAGVFSLEDGLRLITTRARLMNELPSNGAMVSTLASVETVQAAIAPYAGQISIAAYNGPDSIVFSGYREAVEAVAKDLESREFKVKLLQVSRAGHSPLMDPILSKLEQVADEIKFSMPQIPIVSNVTGKLAGKEIATSEYWLQHLRQPVRFIQGMQVMQEQGVDIYLEVGPKPVLLNMGRLCVPGGEGNWLPSLKPEEPDCFLMLQSLAQLYALGVTIDWSGFDGDYSRNKVSSLPVYPFQQQRYWLD